MPAGNQYIPRLYPQGDPGSPSNISAAFDSLKEAAGSMAINSTLSDAVDRYRDANDEPDPKKRADLQTQLSQKLGAQLVGLGMPANHAQLIQGAFQPKQQEDTQQQQQQLPNNETQLAYLAAQEQQQNKPGVATAAYQALKAGKAEKGDPEDKAFKRTIQEQKVFADFSKTISPDEKARSAFAQSVQTINKAQNLIQLIGPNTTLEELNKISPQFVAEAATSLASMVKNGQVTEGEIHQFMPETSGMRGAKLSQFLTNLPTGANVGGFMRLYLASAKRESSLSAQTVAESILSKATGNSTLAKLNPDRFKQEIASSLNTFGQKSLSADDIILDSKTGKVSTKEQQANDDLFALHSKAVAKQKMALNSQDPQVRQSAQDYLHSLGVDPDDNLPAMRATLKARVRGGDPLPNSVPQEGQSFAPNSADSQQAATKGPSLSPEDVMAIQWARNNPNKPQAIKILKLHGLK